MSVSRRKKRRFLIGYGIFLILCVVWGALLWKGFSSPSVEDAEKRKENVPYPVSSQPTREAVVSPPRFSSSEKILLSVPYLSQENALPTGCEIVSTVMLLQYYSIPADTNALIDRYLECGELELRGKMRYGPDPNEAFVGSPYRSDSFGCYAPVIQKALQRLFQEERHEFQVKNTTGVSLETLCCDYVSGGTPVLVWASINMAPIEEGLEWFLNGSGRLFTWTKNEHCLVLVGYDASHYYFNDPYSSNGVVSYDKELADQRYQEMGRQSLIIEPLAR